MVTSYKTKRPHDKYGRWVSRYCKISLSDIRSISYMNQIEIHELEQCEIIIERGLKTFYEVGQALMQIRDNRLYKNDYPTFEAYCSERWGMKRSTAYDYIDAASVYNNVQVLGQNSSPLNREQVRPLTSLEPQQQRDVWRQAVDTAPNGRVTGAHVKQKVLDHMRRNNPDFTTWEDYELPERKQQPLTPQPQNTEWSQLPEAKDILSWVKQTNQHLDSLERATKIGKLSPEGKRFLANKLTTIINRLNNWKTELE